MNKFKLIASLCFFSIVITSCNLFNRKKLVEVRFYCWCFNMHSQGYSYCNTTTAILPKQMVSDSSSYKGTITARQALNYINQEIINNGVEEASEDNYCSNLDTRIVFLVEYSDQSVDTVSYINEHSLCINNTLFRYEERIDSILEELNMPQLFNCPEKLEEFPFKRE